MGIPPLGCLEILVEFHLFLFNDWDAKGSRSKQLHKFLSASEPADNLLACSVVFVSTCDWAQKEKKSEPGSHSNLNDNPI